MTSNNNHLPSWATQEPTLQDCQFCGGKHEDILMCPLAPKRYAVIRAWRTELMPAPAFETYHEECWQGQRATLTEQPMLSGGSVRLVDVREIATYATCETCDKPLQ